MFYLIINILMVVLGFLAMISAGIYNLHMFQQNSYINSEEITWLIKHNDRQRILILNVIVGVLSILNFWPLKVLVCLLMILNIWYFIKMEGLSQKKPLNWTTRMKRLRDTYTVLIVLGILFSRFVFKQNEMLLGAYLLFLVALTPFFVILSNTINAPVEKMVRTYYINDAKKILKSMPNLKIIGITGSYGKTSVKYYLDTLLKAGFNVVKTPASFNTPMGVVKTIRGDLKNDTEIFLCEMGARGVGEIKELCDIVHPDDGIIASIGPQHLETFGSIENIISTKYELGDAIRPNRHLFLNMDCDYVRDNAKNYDTRVLYGTNVENTSEEVDGVKKNVGYYAKDISADENGTEFTVVTPENEEQTYKMKLIGEHNVINVVGAIAIAHMYGIPLNKLVTQVRRLRPAPHRLQMIPRGNVTIIDDAYNSNPVGSKAAVETLGMFKGTRILITPGMVELGDKEDEYNRAFGGYAAKNCDFVALVGEKHTRPIYEGLIDEGFSKKNIFVGETLQEAMNFANTISCDGRKFILLENDLTDNY
ncbi:MAG: UDP-N-acetylmuramoyl-tripeptide--D-alanyl-D-alanine ligase [Lachnospiraceae bacterium]|nr:UDP-N-acetylmuramoyl-tripeptide--D-alanyl-D-alanine ligase [Lachnospiraceae bacterium]